LDQVDEPNHPDPNLTCASAGTNTYSWDNGDISGEAENHPDTTRDLLTSRIGIFTY